MSIAFLEKLKRLAGPYGRHCLVVFVAVLVVHDIFGTHGFLAMHRKQQEIQKVNGQLNRLNKENEALQQDVKDLKSDPKTIERIAREELGQAKPGEVIIRLPAPPPASTTATKP